MSTAKERRTTAYARLTDQQKARIDELLRQHLTIREIGKRIGCSHTAVHTRRRALGLPTAHELRQTPAGKLAEAERSRRKRAAARAERRLVAAAPVPAPRPPRPPLPAPRPGKLTRAEEQELVDRAIAAGIGARYIRPIESAPALATVPEALAWLADQAIPIESRQAGTIHRYRLRGEGAWLPPARFVAAVRMMARAQEMIRVPIPDAELVRSMAASRQISRSSVTEGRISSW